MRSAAVPVCVQFFRENSPDTQPTFPAISMAWRKVRSVSGGVRTLRYAVFKIWREKTQLLQPVVRVRRAKEGVCP